MKSMYALGIGSLVVMILPAAALGYGAYRDLVPYGNTLGCTMCHTNQVFKSDFASNDHTWNSTLASKDSDGDSYPNGAELQDPNGAWRPGNPDPGDPGLISNPDDATSVPPTGVIEGGSSSSLPQSFHLAQNYPNPFNRETNIRYRLPTRASLSLNVYNIAGQLVKTLVDQPEDAGDYTVGWDGTDDAQQEVSAGIYLCRLSAGTVSIVKKMVVIR